MTEKLNTGLKSYEKYSVLALALMASAFPHVAFASGFSTQLDVGLSGLISFLNGGVARSLAVLAVIGFGIGALTGRVDWIKALIVVVAIGIIFSASSLVDLFIPK